jgi:hypothetical protein
VRSSEGVGIEMSCREAWRGRRTGFIRSSFESIGTVSLDLRRNRGVCVSDALNFPQLSIGFDSNITNGRSVAGFFNRGRVFQPTIMRSVRHGFNVRCRWTYTIILMICVSFHLYQVLSVVAAESHAVFIEIHEFLRRKLWRDPRRVNCE